MCWFIYQGRSPRYANHHNTPTATNNYFTVGDWLNVTWSNLRDQGQSSHERQGRNQSSPVASFTRLWTVSVSLRFVEESVPETTRANTKWAVTTLQEWVAERSGVTHNDIPVSVTNATNQQLSYWLPLSITENRKHDGKRYPGRTLYNLCAALQRSVREYRWRVW